MTELKFQMRDIPVPTENRSSNSEIKPCPFCGEKAELHCTAGPDPDWFVQCTECRASADVFSEDNLTGWNDRAHPPTSDGFSAGDMADQGAKAFAARDGEVERLRAALKFYADREHYHFESGNWDTVSGEPLNILWCGDEPDFIEDGSVARAALERQP